MKADIQKHYDWQNRSRAKQLAKGGLKRTPLAKQSKKKSAELRARRKIKTALVVERGQACQARLPGCTGQAECMHEIKKRSQCGSATDPDNILLVCVRCNGWIEDNAHILNTWDPEKRQRVWRKSYE